MELRLLSRVLGFTLALVLTLAKPFNPFELHFLIFQLGIIVAQILRVVVLVK